MHQRATPRSEPVDPSATGGDTIAAICTAVGEAAIALIRISGEGALAVSGRIFRGKRKPSNMRSHTQHLGDIVENGAVIDQVMLSVHRAPSSYTGEDLVEISCHGGLLVTARILEACLRAGARGARPGEFTERAYLNHKIDLTQAEAVIDLIRAQTDLALRSATEQLNGRLGNEFRSLRSQLVEVLAHADAAIDFPEEGISPDDIGALQTRLTTLNARVDELVATAKTGRILRDGLRLVIFGSTNAGKSSLLNRMLGFDRAIVSETHGTTRDTIEEKIDLRGVAVRLFDTAGLRLAENAIEREGIQRTERSLETADFRLHIVDANVPRPGDFEYHPSELLVLNKNDLPEHSDWSETSGIRISCKTGEGLGSLEEAIFERMGGSRISAESGLAVNGRHLDLLQRAGKAIEWALEAIGAGATPEMFAIDLREGLRAMDDLLGGSVEESVRDVIFSQFCIGK